MQATDLTTWVTLMLQVLSAVEDTPAATLLAVLIPNLVKLPSTFPSKKYVIYFILVFVLGGR